MACKGPVGSLLHAVLLECCALFPFYKSSLLPSPPPTQLLRYRRARAALSESVGAQREAEHQAAHAIASLSAAEEMQIDAERWVAAPSWA
jgi:hypothetical protein